MYTPTITDEEKESLKRLGIFESPATDRAPVTQPTKDLILSLCSAVVRSEDDDVSASVALEQLQKRVLMACARFEAASVIV